MTTSIYDLIAQGQEENSSELEVLRLSENETIVSFVSANLESESTHFIKYDGVQSYVKCMGEDCLPCKTGFAKNLRHMMSVFSHETNSVAVLAITNNIKPGALLPQVLNLFKKEQDEQKGRLFRQVVGITRKGNRFTVTPMHPLPEDGLKEMNQVIENFKRNYREGMLGEAVNLRMSADELMAIPEIARIARLKGVDVGPSGLDIMNSFSTATDSEGDTIPGVEVTDGEGSGIKEEPLPLDFGK